MRTSAHGFPHLRCSRRFVALRYVHEVHGEPSPHLTLRIPDFYCAEKLSRTGGAFICAKHVDAYPMIEALVDHEFKQDECAM